MEAGCTWGLVSRDRKVAASIISNVLEVFSKYPSR